MEKLKKKIMIEFIIIFSSLFTVAIYIAGLIAGLISSNIYFSNFLLTTIQTIFAGVILIFMFPIYFHDLKKLEDYSENITNTIKPFWRICIIALGLISITSMICYLIMWGLVLLLNLTSPVLNMIATMLMIIMIIFTSIFFIIIFIRTLREKPIVKKEKIKN